MRSLAERWQSPARRTPGPDARRIADIDAPDPADHHALRAFLDARIDTVPGRIHADAVRTILAIAGVQAERGVRGGVGAIGADNARLAVLLALLAGPLEGAVVVDAGATCVGGGGRRPAVEALRAELTRCVPEPDLVAILVDDGTQLTYGDLVDAADGPLRLVGIGRAGGEERARRGLELAAGALAPGGVVLLEEGGGRERPDLGAGAARFLSEPRGPALVPFAAGGDRLWLTGSEADAAFYRGRLDAAPPAARSHAHGALAGHEVVVIGAGAEA